MSLTIAMLSWGSPKTLRNTLESYEQFSLEADEKMIFFQQGTGEDVKIALEYGYGYQLSKENIGIGPAIQKLVAQATGDYFLFLENDWVAIEDCALQISVGKAFLEFGTADVVKYRSRWTPGGPLWSLQYRGHELDRPEYLLDSVHWQKNPDELWPTKIQKIDVEIAGETDKLRFYRTTSEYANYTNNPSMYKTEFLRSVVVPRAYSDGIRLEADIQDWWKEQKFKVVQGDGLFTHHRID